MKNGWERKFGFTKLQVAVHVLSWIPLAVLVFDYLGNNLGFYPAQEVTTRTGNLAIISLMLSLACTPLYTLTRYAPVIKLRRPLGLCAFMYAFLHVLSFTGLDYGFNWAELLRYAVEKRYIIAGLASFTILLLLAMTSSKKSMAWLGKNWKRLHSLVYLAAPLAVLHFAWLVKGNLSTLSGDILQPLLFAILTTLLLFLRIPPVRQRIITIRNRLFPVKKVIISTRPENRKISTN